MKISEIFFSLQGEGIEIGLPTVFVRLFACDLRCSWCDTMYAVEGRDFKDMTVEAVAEEAASYGCRRVCITGGEPLIQAKEAAALAAMLTAEGYCIVLETSGHKMPPPEFWGDNTVISMDCKCPGSGMNERMDFGLFLKLRPGDQLKFVIADDADYEYAKRVISENDIRANIIFQPAGGEGLGMLTDRVLADRLGRVRVLPQLHKILWGNKRGV
ncbi:MAG: radical SAM protein [Candidatus Dadabacteria bacterium]|nr:radical SAM protein [Candidatus Dadabacteria bacterium]